MFWFVFDWHWDIGHIIFFGLFYAVLIVIGVGLAMTVAKSVVDRMIDPLNFPGAPKDEHH